MPAGTIAAAATTARAAATATVNVAVTVAGKDNLISGDSRRACDHSGRCGDDRRDGSHCHERRFESFPSD
jgi:hypothetical protein